MAIDRPSLVKCEEAFFIANRQLGLAGDDITRLSEPVRMFLLVYGAQGVIDNGGYKYFFGQDWPDNTPYEKFISAYEFIGCESQAKELRRVVTTFPFSDPHLHKELRAEYIKQNYDPDNYSVRGWGDDLCGDKVVWNKLAEHYEKNKQAFNPSGTSDKPSLLRFPSRDAKDADHLAILAMASGIYLLWGRTHFSAAAAPWVYCVAPTSILTGILLWLRVPASKCLGVLVFIVIAALALRRRLVESWGVGSWN